MTPYISLRSTLAVLSLAMALILAGTPAMAQNSAPYPNTKIVKTSHAYKTLVQRLGKAIAKNKIAKAVLFNMTLSSLGRRNTRPSFFALTLKFLEILSFGGKGEIIGILVLL